MNDWLMIGSIFAGVAAAGLALVAAHVPIRDQIDWFMSDIYRQGWWASWAAFAAAVGVLMQAGHYFLYR